MQLQECVFVAASSETPPLEAGIAHPIASPMPSFGHTSMHQASPERPQSQFQCYLGHFTLELEGPWLQKSKLSNWWKRLRPSHYTNTKALRAYRTKEVWIDEKPTRSPTWHAINNVSWSTRLCTKPTSKRWVYNLEDHGTSKAYNHWFIITYYVDSPHG